MAINAHLFLALSRLENSSSPLLICAFYKIIENTRWRCIPLVYMRIYLLLRRISSCKLLNAINIYTFFNNSSSADFSSDLCLVVWHIYAYTATRSLCVYYNTLPTLQLFSCDRSIWSIWSRVICIFPYSWWLSDNILCTTARQIFDIWFFNDQMNIPIRRISEHQKSVRYIIFRRLYMKLPHETRHWIVSWTRAFFSGNWQNSYIVYQIFQAWL